MSSKTEYAGHYFHLSAKVKLESGLHLRNAAQIVKMCIKYPANIFMENDGAIVSAKSIMGLAMLAAGPGSKLDIYVEGSDKSARDTALKLKSGLENEVDLDELNFEAYLGREDIQLKSIYNVHERVEST